MCHDAELDQAASEGNGTTAPGGDHHDKPGWGELVGSPPDRAQSSVGTRGGAADLARAAAQGPVVRTAAD
jgi:hypothetical protein